MTSPCTIQSVDRALRLLEYLAKNNGTATLTELSKGVGLPSSTVHRFLSTLVNSGYIAQDNESGKYVLGLEILSLSSALLATMDERKLALPLLVRLAQITGETANLCVRDGTDVVYIEKAEPDSSVRVFSRIGKRAPVHATGVGKLFLSDLPPYKLTVLFESGSLPILTKNTCASLDDLLPELELTRKQGYAFDLEECEVGARCVAAPVRDHRGRIVCGLSVSGPTRRLTKQRMHAEILPLVLNASYELSAKLGFKNRSFTEG